MDELFSDYYTSFLAITCDKDDLTIGDDIKLTVSVDKSQLTKRIKLQSGPTLTLCSIYQTGEIYKSIVTKELNENEMDHDTWTGVFTITAEEYSDLLAPDHFGLLRANAFFQFMRGDDVDIVSDRFDFGVSQRDKGVMSICTDCADTDVNDPKITFNVQVENTTLKPMNGITVTVDYRGKTLKTDERLLIEITLLGAREIF